MKNQPNRNCKSDDVVMTPEPLCKEIVEHFKPTEKILEPCKGTGNFLKYMKADWCEINEGKDFFDYDKKVDWIITNPPWSQIRPFLKHSMKVADNIVFLVTVNHLWTKARIRDLKESGFWVKEILLLDIPKEFPQSGFQLGAILITRGDKGDTKIQ